MPRITLAGEDLIAQKQAAKQPLNITRFIFANVPGLNPSNEVDRAAPKPPAGQIVYSAEIPAENKGYVNPSQVVYSLQVGSDIGDWDFNWIGLESAEGVLFAVAYMPLQQKRRNIPPLQIGNNITRNFLVVFDGAQALTGITIDASTWQHDFTVRLAGIDERERQSNRDTFGRACFFGSALQLEKVGSVYQLKAGTAYVEGVRVQRSTVLPVAPPGFPTTAWLDVALQRELNDVVATWSVVWGAGKVDYVDTAGVQHYCVAIADLPNSNTITDSRPVENIAGPLVVHFAARVGDYAGLRARSTTKDDVGLGNLPNAKSDDENTNSSLILATTKAVKAATSTIWTAIANIVSGATTVGKASRLATTRTIGGVAFDGTANISLPGVNAVGNQNTTGNAATATKLATPRTLSLTGGATGSGPFDGSGNVAIPVDIPILTAMAGAISFFASNSAPSGWLKANGAAVSRTTYATLFAAIGTTFGAGNGSTTFNLPDLRGEFIRGWDDGRGVDVARSFGTQQLDALQNITGSANSRATYGLIRQGDGTVSGAFKLGQATNGCLAGTSSAAHALELDASLVARTADETRPRNIAMLACIKY